MTPNARLAAVLILLSASPLAAAQAPRDRVTPPVPLQLRQEPRVEKLVRLKAAGLLRQFAGGGLSDPSEYTVRARTSTLLIVAACLKFASCGEPERAREAYKEMLAGLARSHFSGGGATASGKPWGHEWQSSFWTWQAAFSAWLMWEELDPPLRQALLAMAVDEADRFLELPAPYARFLDTKAEENAWNSMLLALLGEVLESHPHRRRWRQRAVEYMISAFATPADRFSARIVDGRPLSAWLGGANVHPDFTLENHGFIHPDYMSCISLNLTNALVYRLLGRDMPQAVAFNAQRVYDVLKFFTTADGGLFYPGSTDWSLHRLELTWSTALQMDRLTQDPQAGALGELALETMERMFARYGDGRMFASYEFTSYKTIEEILGTSLATGLMFSRLWPPAKGGQSLETVWKKLEGARVFDEGRLFVVRTPAAISSFSWGARIMGVTAPFARDPIVWPADRSYFGLGVPVPGEPRARPGRLGIGSRAFEQAVQQDDTALQGAIQGSENGATFVVLRGRQAGRSKAVCFTALPTGRSVYMERVNGDTRAVSGGMIALAEEPEWFHGRAPRLVERDGNRWVNVDGRLGYAMSENGAVEVVEDVRSRLLVLNKAPRSGSIAVIVTLPGATVEETRAFASQPFRLKVRQEGVAAVEIDGLLTVANLTSHPLTAEVERSAGIRKVDVHGFSTRVVDTRRFPGAAKKLR